MTGFGMDEAWVSQDGGGDQTAAMIRDALSELNQGILVIDQEHRIAFVNATYCRFFGFDTGEALIAPGAAYEGVLHTLAVRGALGPGDVSNLIALRMAPVKQKARFEMDRQIVNGCWVHITGVPMENGGYVFTFTDVTERVEEQARLDRLVRERTTELHAANRKLLDGIEYARMIQTGILPKEGFFDQHIGPNFLFFRPADIVGGDFYVGVKTDYGIYVGLGDCTGHGVPGAMMTMMAASVTRRAINETGMGGPAAVMMAVDRIVRTNLHQTEAEVGPDNGLELSLCLIEPDFQRIRLCGAGLEIFLQGDGTVERWRGTKHGLGYGRQSTSASLIQETVFTRKQVQRVFFSSDGILDQSGGEKGFGFGRRRLMEALQDGADKPIQVQGQGLIDVLEAYRGNHPQRDDLAVMGFCPYIEN